MNARSLSALLALCVLSAARPARSAETLLVVEKRAERLAAYDAASGKELWSVAVGHKPHEMAVTRDASLAYVTNYGVDSYNDGDPGGNSISIVDLKRHAAAGEIDLGEIRRPHGIELGASGRLYVTADQPASVLVIDAERRKVLRRVALDQKLPHMLAVTRDETRAYTANSGSGTISVVSLEGNEPPRNVDVGGIPMGFGWSQDRGRLFATNRDGNTLFVLDPASGDVIRRVEIAGQPVRLALAPDGRHLLASTIQAGDLVVVDTDSMTVVRRLPAGARAEGVAIDAAGRFAYVSSQEENKVVKFSLSEWKPVLEIHTRERPDPVAIVD